MFGVHRGHAGARAAPPLMKLICIPKLVICSVSPAASMQSLHCGCKTSLVKSLVHPVDPCFYIFFKGANKFPELK